MSRRVPLAAAVARRYDRLARLFATDGATRLAWVMLLPFVGIYQALVAAGALSSVSAAIGLGTVVFGGGATLSVVAAELDVPRRTGLEIVGVIGVGLCVGTALSAVIAPAIAAVLWVGLLTRLTAVVLGVIAVRIVYTHLPWWVPSVRVIGLLVVCLLGLNLVVSVATGRLELTAVATRSVAVLTTDRALVGRSLLAGLSGWTLAVGAVLFRPTVVRVLDVRRFEVGCAIALSTVGAELASVVETPPVLFIVGCSLCLSVKREHVEDRDEGSEHVEDGGEA